MSDDISATIAECMRRALADLGVSFWRHGMEPHFAALRKSHKKNFRYRISLSELKASTEIGLGEKAGSLLIQPREFLRLEADLHYHFTVASPPSEYYVGCVFSASDLPAWFEVDNFFLRELVAIPRIADEHERLQIDTEQALAIASKIFPVSVQLDGIPLEPSAEVLFESKGIRWTFPLTSSQQQVLTNGAPVDVAVTTYQPRSQTYYPVNITSPTRGVVVQFEYQRTKIGSVHVEPFFSSRRPYRVGVVKESLGRREITVEPADPDDWVFFGDGCVFMWSDPR